MLLSLRLLELLLELLLEVLLEVFLGDLRIDNGNFSILPLRLRFSSSFSHCCLLASVIPSRGSSFS